jgi:hypothetical protein
MAVNMADYMVKWSKRRAVGLSQKTAETSKNHKKPKIVFWTFPENPSFPN